MRILLAAEFTRDERVPVLADALTEAGHSVTLAVRDPLAWQPRASVQAPAWRAEPPPGFLASTYADILLHAGYATLEALHGLLTGWLDLFARTQPDLLLADFAPTAMLASRIAGLAVAVSGDGYSLPPPTEPLPAMRRWANQPSGPAVDTEGRVLAVANSELSRLGGHPLPALADLFRDAEAFLCTVAELDHYPDRGAADYFGPIYAAGTGDSPEWSPGSAERCFARIDGRRPLLAPLIAALDTLGLPAIVQADRISPSLAASLSRPRVLVVAETVDRDAALASCDFVACEHSAMVAPALLAARPVLMLPRHVEQLMTLHRIAPQGLGHGVPADADAAGVDAALRRLLDDAACRQRVAGFARSYQGYQPVMAADAVVGGVKSLTEETPPSR